VSSSPAGALRAIRCFDWDVGGTRWARVGFTLGDAYKALAEMRKTAPYLPPSPPISPYL